MIYKQSVFDEWPIESKSVQAVITSPPYYALRKYDIPDVLIGDYDSQYCGHDWGEDLPPHKKGQVEQTKYKNAEGSGKSQNSTTGKFCKRCNAWIGQYGLEPTPQMYVEHTRLWAQEACRVLKDDGILFLNLADSYSTQSGGMAQGNWGMMGQSYNKGQGKIKQPKIKDYPNKCQLLIPHKIAIALIEDNWTLRNTIVWFKPNAMPESVTDRFSKKYEYIFMFTKSEKYYFDLEAVKEPLKFSSIQRNKYIYGQSGVKHEELRRISGKPQGWKNHLKNKNPGDVWQIPTQPSTEKHYAMWPEYLVERMVKCSTKAGDMVLDPFAGSATTLKVAKALGRIGIGIDIGYHDISDRRLSVIQKRFI